MNEALQDEDLAKADLRNQARLEQERMPWESTWREIDERFPNGAGGFNKTTAGQIRGARNYDSTHLNSIDRFSAACVAITTPEEKDYIQPRFLDPHLNELRSVKIWRASAGLRLQAIRHASHTGFGIAANEDWWQMGTYGTSVVWQEAIAGRGLVYRTLHMSECYIDVDVAGLVDTVQRKFVRTARQLEQLFGRDGLTPKMIEALERPGREHAEFEILHVVTPNTAWDADRLDHRRFPIASRYLGLDEKIYLRRSGAYTQPATCSRHITAPGEKYGRSPAFKVMPNINGVNAMKLTTLRAGHKAVDPALLFNNDDGVTKLVSRPGGMNAGMVNDAGQPMVHRMPGGEQGLPYAIDMIQDEREDIKSAFLEDFYKILTDPNSRMTTTEVLEVMSKQGILVRLFASRYATEKQLPQTQRDLDLAIRAGQIDPFPPEVVEAGAWPVMDYDNDLAAMAKAQRTSKTLRYVQALPILYDIDPDVRLRVDADAIAVSMAEEMGVNPTFTRSDEEVAALKGQKEEMQAAAFDAEQLQQVAGATADLAQAQRLSEAA